MLLRSIVFVAGVGITLSATGIDVDVVGDTEGDAEGDSRRNRILAAISNMIAIGSNTIIRMPVKITTDLRTVVTSSVNDS